MAIPSLNLRVNSLLDASDTKIDFLLRGHKSCFHPDHEKKVDKDILEQKIHVGRLVFQLCKVRNEIEIANTQLRRINVHSKRAREIKKQLLEKVKKIDSEAYRKLASELRIKEFSTSDYFNDVRSMVTTTTNERAIDVVLSPSKTTDSSSSSSSTNDNVLKESSSHNVEEKIGPKTAMFFGIAMTPSANDDDNDSCSDIDKLEPSITNDDASDSSDDDENTPAVGPKTAMFFGISTPAKSSSSSSSADQPPPSKFIAKSSPWDGACTRTPTGAFGSDSDDDDDDDDCSMKPNTRTSSFFSQFG